MWNSPHSLTREGKRYDVRDIAVLTHPLGVMVDSMPPEEGGFEAVQVNVNEKILIRMNREEQVYALYEVLHALLEDDPAPEEGHPGYQEAMVAELLYQTFEQAMAEREQPDDYTDFALKSAWQSILRLLATRDERGKIKLPQLDGLGLDLNDPQAYFSPAITAENWEAMFDGLWHQFLRQDSWRLDEIMDFPQEIAQQIATLSGIDVAVVHRLPHTPTRPELCMAEHYIKYVMWKDETTRPG